MNSEAIQLLLLYDHLNSKRAKGPFLLTFFFYESVALKVILGLPLGNGIITPNLTDP